MPFRPFWMMCISFGKVHPLNVVAYSSHSRQIPKLGMFLMIRAQNFYLSFTYMLTIIMDPLIHIKSLFETVVLSLLHFNTKSV